MLNPGNTPTRYFPDAPSRRHGPGNRRRDRDAANLIFDHVPLGLLRFDQSGLLKACNPAFAEQMQASPETLAGFDWSNRGAAEGGREAVRTALAGGAGSYEGELTSRAGGEPYYGRLLTYPVTTAEGTLEGGLGIVQDLTELKRTEQERQRIAGLYKVLSHANKAIVHATEKVELFQEVCRVCAEFIPLELAFISCLDPSGDGLEILAAAGSRLGFLHGLTPSHGQHDPAHLDPVGFCMAGLGENLCPDWELASGDRTWRDRVLAFGLRASVALPLVCEGKRVGVLTLFSPEPSFFCSDRLELVREIVGDSSFALDRFARDAQRQDAEEAFRATFEQAAVGITHVALDGTYLKFNQRFSEMIGYPEAELLGRLDRDITQADDRQEDAEETQALRDGIRPSSCWEKRYICKDGSTIWVRVTLALLHDRLGAPTLFVTVVEDLTLQKQAAAERQGLVEDLHQAQKMESLGSLSAGIAHDMNNILAAILGTAEIMQMSGGSADTMPGHVATIIRASERGRDLVKNLVAFARKGLQEPQLLDLNELVRDEVELLGRTTLNRITVHSDLAPGLEPLLGEPSAITSVLMNLCLNARNAMADGGQLTIRTAQLPDHWLALDVTDQGHGMRPEVLAKALDPFFTTQPVGKGTGLGLTIAFAVIKSHGGTLSIQSTPGVGTTVSLRFPSTPGELIRRESPGPQTAPMAQPVRILLVDDDVLLLDIMPKLLTTQGHSTETAVSGQAALDRLDAGLEVDLVILDQNMPGLTGMETLKRIRNRWPDLPVILGTGYLNASVEAELIGQDYLQVLHKPYSSKDIRRAIEHAVAPVRGPAESPSESPIPR